LYFPLRRAYTHINGPGGFTLGTITHAYDYRSINASDRATWNTMLSRVDLARRGEFEQLVQRMSQAKIHDKRNRLAHGEAISKELATDLHELVIGNMDKPGILRTLAELVDPV